MKNLSEKQLKNQKHYKSLGIAKVCSPLRHVLGKQSVVTKQIVNGAPVIKRELNEVAKTALCAAAYGNGKLVNQLARLS
jgi:hypothetical protein